MKYRNRIKMKIKEQKNKLKLLPALLSLLVATSCASDHQEVPTSVTGETTVTLAIQLPRTNEPATRALTEANENEVSEIDVLVFEPSGGNYVARYSGTNITTDGSDSKRKTFTVALKQGEFDLAIVANSRTSLSVATLTGKTKAEALALLNTEMPSNGKWTANTATSGYKPFPMWGDIGNRTIDSNTNFTGSVISLIRMVARVDVVVAATVGNFQLASVRVYNYNTRGAIAPGPLAWNSQSGLPTSPTILSANTRGPLVYNNDAGKTEINTAGNRCEREIYIFEAENHTTATHTAGKALTERTCLVVGGKYNTDQAETYYRVDFSTASNVLLDVLRNHLYRFQITSVSGRGYPTPDEAFNSLPVNMHAEVKTWNEGAIGEIVFNDQYYLSFDPGREFTFVANASSQTVNIKTDYPGGFQITKITTLAADATTETDISSGGWLTTDRTVGGKYGAGEVNVPLKMNVTQNATGKVRTGYIYITAGRMVVKVKVTQPSIVLAKVRVVDPATNNDLSELLFELPGGTTSGSFKLIWEPASAAVSVTNSNSASFPTAPVTGTIPGGTGTQTYSFTPSFTQAETNANPFIEMETNLTFTVSNPDGTKATATMKLKKRNLAAVVSAPAAKYSMLSGQTGTLTVKANTPWTATLVAGGTAVASLTTASGSGNTSTGQPLTFSMQTGSTSKLTGASTIRISSPTNKFAAFNLTINGEWGSEQGGLWVVEIPNKTYTQALNACPSGYRLMTTTDATKLGEPVGWRAGSLLDWKYTHMNSFSDYGSPTLVVMYHRLHRYALVGKTTQASAYYRDISYENRELPRGYDRYHMQWWFDPKTFPEVYVMTQASMQSNSNNYKEVFGYRTVEWYEYNGTDTSSARCVKN